MTIYTKPAVRAAWGDTAVPGAGNDIVDPNTYPSAAERVAPGWPSTATPPARQYFNWVLNWVSQGIRYFCQRGVADYDSAETYGAGATVRGPDGILYQALVATTGNTPASSPAQWGPLTAASPTSTADNTNKVATTSWVQSVLAFFAPLASPTFTGTPAAPTPTVGDSTTKLATTAFVSAALSNLSLIHI